MPTAKDFRVEPGGGSYVVTGTVECPTGGWGVTLLPDPAATTPERAALTVRVTAPQSPVAQVITPYAVNRVVSGVSSVVVTLTGGVTTEDGATTIELPVP